MRSPCSTFGTHSNDFAGCLAALTILALVLGGCVAGKHSVVADAPQAQQPRHWVLGRSVTPQARDLLAMVQNADRYGLSPASYGLAQIERSITGGAALDPQSSEQLEKSLNSLFLSFAKDLLYGSLAPLATVQPGFKSVKENVALPALLDAAVQGNKVRPALESLLPAHPAYLRLQKALAWYRQIAREGGWGTIPPGTELREGDEGERVLALRTRLVASADLPLPYYANDVTDSEWAAEAGSDSYAARAQQSCFDEQLKGALVRFQKRHGLDPSGVLDPLTLHELNLPVQARIRQLEMNLERWRWLARELGSRHVLVDIPAFELQLIEAGRVVLTSPVIVGQPNLKTPVFSSRITSFVINPFWVVPQSIALLEMIPRIREDQHFLAENRIQVEQGEERSDILRDPASIPWDKIGNKLDFVLVQKSGRANPMGQLKFVIPGDQAIFIHDTPDKQLFDESVRAFSHGCVRTKNPVQLAAYLSGRADPATIEQQISQNFASEKEISCPLKEPVPVHFTYFTAGADEDGVVSFRPDIYGYDRKLYQTMLDRKLFTD